MKHGTTASRHGDTAAAGTLTERRAGRFATIDLNCSVGKVLDLSRSGMRVQARTMPSGRFPVEIQFRNETVNVMAEVVWFRRAGMFSKHYGLQFIDVSRELVTRLALIAQATSRRSSI